MNLSLVLNLGLEYICGSMDALLNQIKFTYRELRFGLLVETLA